MIKNSNIDVFDVDKLRHALARDGDIEELKKSYGENVYPELPDLSSVGLWDSLATGTAAPAFRTRRLKAVAEKIPSGSRVLDVGVGWGEIIPMISARGGCRYTGIDFSGKIISEVTKKYPDCQFIVGGVASIVETFDVVLALEVCEHILPTRILEFLGEVKRVLSKDGLLIVTVPVYENLRDATLHCPKCGAIHSRMGHVRAYTPELITAELKLAGFDVCKAFFVYANFESSLGGWVKRRLVDLGRMAFRLGTTKPLNVVIVARSRA